MRPEGRPVRKVAEKPRRVRRGKRLISERRPVGRSSIALAWEEWINTTNCTAAAKNEGFEYAREGQITMLEVHPGLVKSGVQGRSSRPYSVEVTIPGFPDEQWDHILNVVGREARYAASLLAGEMPGEVEATFSSLGSPLTPQAEEKIEVSCNCTDFRKKSGPCKHIVAAFLLLVEQLDAQPLLALTMRGMSAEKVLDRLRVLRAVEAGGGSADVLHPIEMPDECRQAPALETLADRFFDAGPELGLVFTTLAPPEVSHALLRRLGPSPCEGARFPLIGLLASCYEHISRTTLRELLLDPDEGDFEFESESDSDLDS